MAPKYFASAQRLKADRPVPCGKGGCSTMLKVSIHTIALPRSRRHKACRVHSGQSTHTIEQRVVEVGSLGGFA